MKKTILVICSILAVSAFIIFNIFVSTNSPILWEDDFENGLFKFNSSRHTVNQRVWLGHEGLLPSFEEFNTLAMHPGRIIIVGEVVGPSINRVIHPRWDLWDPATPSADNYVITPVLVHHIIHLGDEILNDVRVGEVIDVREGHFFVTPESQPYADGIPIGEIMANFGTIPMESGHRYLMFIHNGGNDPESPYNYNGEIILGSMHRRSFYRLGTLAPGGRGAAPNDHPLPDWHAAALAMYGHLHQELPLVPPPPTVVPRTSSEFNIIIQGTPIATAIYDVNGNRLIQEGLGLYRQLPGGGRERVGQRVSISHALRRFKYILEPGEYTFKNLDFSGTALPSNVQVLGFENYERAALTFYEEVPSSNHIELKVMANGTAVLTDVTTNTIIPPTEVDLGSPGSNYPDDIKVEVSLTTQGDFFFNEEPTIFFGEYVDVKLTFSSETADIAALNLDFDIAIIRGDCCYYWNCCYYFEEISRTIGSDYAVIRLITFGETQPLYGMDTEREHLATVGIAPMMDGIMPIYTSLFINVQVYSNGIFIDTLEVEAGVFLFQDWWNGW